MKYIFFTIIGIFAVIGIWIVGWVVFAVLKILGVIGESGPGVISG